MSEFSKGLRNSIGDFILGKIKDAEQFEDEWTPNYEDLKDPTPPQEIVPINEAEIVAGLEEIDYNLFLSILKPILKTRYGVHPKLYLDHIMIIVKSEKCVAKIKIKIIKVGIEQGLNYSGYLIRTSVSYVPKFQALTMLAKIQEIRSYIQTSGYEILKQLLEEHKPIPIEDIDDLDALIKIANKDKESDIVFIMELGLHRHPFNPGVAPDLVWTKVGLSRRGRQKINIEKYQGYSNKIYGQVSLDTAVFQYEQLGFTVRIVNLPKDKLHDHKKVASRRLNEFCAETVERWKKYLGEPNMVNNIDKLQLEEKEKPVIKLTKRI